MSIICGRRLESLKKTPGEYFGRATHVTSALQLYLMNGNDALPVRIVCLSTIHSLRAGPLQASNRYKMQLQGLEDQLLQRLADAPADILADVALIEVGPR